MRAPRSPALAAALVLACLTDSEIALADDKAGTTKVTVIGLDGKPVAGADIGTGWVGTMFMDHVDGAAVEGEIVIVSASDKAGNKGRAVVYVPDNWEVPVTIQLWPAVNFSKGEAKAIKGKKDGDPKLRQEGYDEAKAAHDESKAQIDQTQRAIDEWARANKIPIMKLSAVTKQIDAIEKLGLPADKANLEKLRSYQAKLEDLGTLKKFLEAEAEHLAALSEPERKVTGVPSTCPEGQSGGLLAGLLNSATGTNSFTGICNDKEKQKDSRGGPGAAGRDHGERDHGKHED